MNGMGSHQSAAAKSVTWLTPKPILDALGTWEGFDLDPCAAPDPRPWPTAWRMNSLADGDGLAIEWDGRIWCNPPYTNSDVGKWLDRLATHGRGTALIFARTETENFQRHVWQRASGLLFLSGRLFFHHADGTPAQHNAGAPSVLCAYGQEDMDILAASCLDGAFVPLKLARGILVAGLDQSWRECVADWLARQTGPVNVSDAYRYFAGHPKAKANPHWRAKVRQKLQQVGSRIERGQYERKFA